MLYGHTPKVVLTKHIRVGPYGDRKWCQHAAGCDGHCCLARSECGEMPVRDTRWKSDCFAYRCLPMSVYSVICKCVFKGGRLSQNKKSEQDYAMWCCFGFDMINSVWCRSYDWGLPTSWRNLKWHFKQLPLFIVLWWVLSLKGVGLIWCVSGHWLYGVSNHHLTDVTHLETLFHLCVMDLLQT